MKDGFIRVACANYEIKLGNVEHNKLEIIKQSLEAAKNNAQVLLFPELCLTGYSIGDLVFQSQLLNDVEKAIDDICQETVQLDTVIVFGAPLKHKNSLYNCAIIIKNGDILGVVPKTELANYHEFYESRYFVPGSKEITNIFINNDYYPFGTQLIFEDRTHQNLKIAIEICEDLWAPLSPSTHHTLNGASLILNLSASNNLVTKSDYRKQLISAHSSKLITGYAYCSAGIGESTTDVVFSNHHLIYENGILLQEAKQYDSNIIYADMDFEKIMNERREMMSYHSRNDDYVFIPFELEDHVLDLKREYNPLPFIPPYDQRAARCQEILDIQIEGLIQRLKAAHIKKVVLGISGGLDSTLALLVTSMAYKKLGYPQKDIIAITMPCFGTTSRTKNNALILMEELGVTTRTIDITLAVQQHLKDINHDENIHDVTYENAQARERTQVLMDVANQEGGIVIGTGDLSEVALGWSTYNGDHMSMYAINCSIPKTLVRYLVDYIASLYSKKPLEHVLKDILNTPVSPELIPAKDNKISQITEDIVGPYELHDFFLYHHARFHYEPRKMFRITQIAFKDKYDNATLKKWLTLFYRRFFTQQFKRSCIPDGPKVGSVALSPRGDLRMPSDADVTAWLNACENLPE